MVRAIKRAHTANAEVLLAVLALSHYSGEQYPRANSMTLTLRGRESKALRAFGRPLYPVEICHRGVPAKVPAIAFLAFS
jgi:hypothetical protein